MRLDISFAQIETFKVSLIIGNTPNCRQTSFQNLCSHANYELPKREEKSKAHGVSGIVLKNGFSFSETQNANKMRPLLTSLK